MALIIGRQLKHGTSPGWAELARLGEAGWAVAVIAAFGGGVLVIASRNGHEVRRSGESVESIARDVCREAVRGQAASW